MSNPIDIGRLKEAMTDMAEVYGCRAPTDRSVGVWQEVLKDLDAQAVLNAIYNWIQTKPKAATPSDIRNLAGAWVSRRLEEREELEKGTEEDFRNTIRREADPCVLRALNRWRKAMKESYLTINRDTWWQTELLAIYGTTGITTAQADAVRIFCHGEPTQERVQEARQKVAAQNERESRILKPFAEFLAEERAAAMGGTWGKA